MKTRTGTLAVLTTALACAPAYAAPAKVDLRVEGATKTLFEGSVKTDGHSLNKDSSGSHPCDGTNGGVNPQPGPTVTSALDDGLKRAGLSWKASWSDDFSDFLVNGIGPDDATSSEFWGNAVNGVPPSVGGCQQQVKAGDEVLWYFGGTFKQILEASAAKTTRVGRTFKVKVIAVVTTFDDTGKSSTSRKPIKGARIGGKKTDAKGIATLRFHSAGVKRLKATKSESVRSNQVRVKVLRKK
jgi:hypothetical protein